MMFFKLNPEARLVLGAKRALIYDFLDNRMYHLSPEEKSVLELSEKGKEVDEISRDLNMPRETVFDLLKNFRDKKLGEFYEKKPYIEPLHTKSPISEKAFFKPPPQCANFFMELNNSCNYECSYCGGNRTERVFGCIGCNVWGKQNEEKSIDIASYIDILDQVHKLAFAQIFLTGGNILEDYDKLSALLDRLKRMRFPNVFLTIHQKQVHEDDIDFLNRYKGLNVFLSCDFPISSKTREIADNLHQNLTLVPVVEVSEISSKKDLMERIQNEHEKAERDIKRGRIMWQADYSSPDFINDYTKIPLFGKERVTSFSANLHFFEWCQENHPCLGGILTVSSSGNVYVCRIMRKKSFGNVLKTSLSEIIRNKKEEIEQVWNLTRDKITPCNSCEYRYSCMDCRVIEKDMHQTNLCAYDPHKGEWIDDLS